MDERITVYHGSQRVITSPTFGLEKNTMISGLGSTVPNTKNLQRSGLFHLPVTAFQIDTHWKRRI